MSELYKEYARIQADKRRLAKKEEKIKELIKSDLRQRPESMLENKFGTFKIVSVNTWKYSEAIAKLQAKEIKNGIANQVVSERLNFTPNIPIK